MQCTFTGRKKQLTFSLATIWVAAKTQKYQPVSRRELLDGKVLLNVTINKSWIAPSRKQKKHLTRAMPKQ